MIGGKLVDLFVVNVTLLQKMFTPPLHCSLLRCAWYDNHLLQINLTIVIPGASYPAHGSISLLVFSWQGRKVLQNVTSPLSPAVRRPCAEYEPVRLRMQFCHVSDQSLESSIVITGTWWTSARGRALCYGRGSRLSRRLSETTLFEKSVLYGWLLSQ